MKKSQIEVFLFSYCKSRCKVVQDFGFFKISSFLYVFRGDLKAFFKISL